MVTVKTPKISRTEVRRASARSAAKTKARSESAKKAWTTRKANAEFTANEAAKARRSRDRIINKANPRKQTVPKGNPRLRLPITSNSMEGLDAALKAAEKGIVDMTNIDADVAKALKEVRRNPRFAAFVGILEEARQLHTSKSHDYGADADPYANLRAAASLGIPPWVGCVLRVNDKMHRISSFLLKGDLKHESVEDSLLDMIVYLACALMLYREEHQ